MEIIKDAKYSDSPESVDESQRKIWIKLDLVFKNVDDGSVLLQTSKKKTKIHRPFSEIWTDISEEKGKIYIKPQEINTKN